MATAATDFEIIDFGTARNLSKSSRPPGFETRGIGFRMVSYCFVGSKPAQIGSWGRLRPQEPI